MYVYKMMIHACDTSKRDTAHFILFRILNEFFNALEFDGKMFIRGVQSFDQNIR